MIPYQLALLLYVPFALLVIASTQNKHRAVIITMFAGMMFLPEAEIEIPIITNISKYTLTSYVTFLGVLMFDRERLFKFRPAVWDIVIALWCIIPFTSGLMVGESLVRALGSIDEPIVMWGVPYLLGRVYFNDLGRIRELAIGFVIAGLIYAPLVLYEIRMSPQIHRIVYGFHSHSFAQTRRWGGWRPVVLFHHGLALSMFIAASASIAYWLARSRQVRQIAGLPMSIIAPFMVILSILCKSTGAAVVTMFCVAGYSAARVRSAKYLVLIALIVPVFYVNARAMGWNANEVLAVVETVMPSRKGTVQFRITHENVFRERALERPIFGWGPKALWRRVDEEKSGMALVSDSMWIITFGKYGFIGLFLLSAIYVMPSLLLFRVAPPHLWTRTAYVFPGALAVVCVAYMVDNLFNAMINPMYTIASGALVAFYQAHRLNESAAPRNLPNVRHQSPPPNLSSARGSRPPSTYPHS